MGTDGATLDLDEHAAMLASRKRPDFVITGVKRDDVATAARVLRARGLAVPLAHCSTTRDLRATATSVLSSCTASRPRPASASARLSRASARAPSCRRRCSASSRAPLPRHAGLPAPRPRRARGRAPGRRVARRDAYSARSASLRVLRFYTTYLCAPAALGFSLATSARGGEAMSDVLPLFNIVITIWSTLLVARWRHREATLASAWGVLNREDEAREKQLVEAVEKGAPRAGLGTFVITLPLYALLLGGNVYGMLRIQHRVETAGGTAPAVMQVAFPIVMKLTFERILPLINELEAHPTKASRDNAMVATRFSFQFVNFYGVLFYVAFFKRDLGRLRSLLRKLLITKQITGNVVEGLVPWLLEQPRVKAELARAQNAAKRAVARVFGRGGGDGAAKDTAPTPARARRARARRAARADSGRERERPRRGRAGAARDRARHVRRRRRLPRADRAVRVHHHVRGRVPARAAARAAQQRRRGARRQAQALREPPADHHAGLGRRRVGGRDGRDGLHRRADQRRARVTSTSSRRRRSRRAAAAAARAGCAPVAPAPAYCARARRVRSPRPITAA